MNIRYFSLIFNTVLFLFLVTLLLFAFGYPTKAKLFPLIIIPLSLGLLGTQLFIDIIAIRHKEQIKEVDRTEQGARTSRNYLDATVWVAATLVGFLLFGNMLLFFLLPLAYSKLHKESWLSSIGLSLGCGISFYIVFDLALEMRFYEGFLFSLLFH